MFYLQALVVLNDLASAYVINKQHKLGIEHYKEAISRAEQAGDMEESLVAFNYNLGEVSLCLKMFINRLREYREDNSYIFKSVVV